ncbi:MAG: lysophospholipid acyltransferase family protein [Planctomycetaceae bacterium]
MVGRLSGCTIRAVVVQGRTQTVKLKSPFAIAAWSLATSAVIRQWMGTLDYQVVLGDPVVDPVHPGYRGAKIYVFWHENILMPLYLRGHSNISMLLSRHWDANILDRVARTMGFGVVRGSTFHGGSAALRELAARAAAGNLTITPDGPRGPRRRLAAGCVFLASTLGIPIVAMGMGYDRPWRAGTWDRFAIPRPFSRARGVISRAVAVPAGLDRDGIERHRSGIELLLSHLSDDAEAWAMSGKRRPDQRPARKEPSRVARRTAAEQGPPGVSLDEELERFGLAVPSAARDDRERPAA